MGKEALNWIIIVLVLAYNGLIVLFVQYLKQHHNELWKSFAGKGFFAAPEFSLDSYRFVRTGWYMLFQSGHQELRDPKATAYIYATRALLVALVPLIAWHASMQ